MPLDTLQYAVQVAHLLGTTVKKAAGRENLKKLFNWNEIISEDVLFQYLWPFVFKDSWLQ